MKTVFVLALLLAPIGFAQAGTAGGFGVTPVQLDFTNPSLLRGGAAEGTLRVQNNFAEEAEVTVTPEGALADWVSIDLGNRFTIPAHASKALAVRLQVPQSVANGDYQGYLRIRATGNGEPSGSGASINVEVLPVIRARIGGEQVVAFVLEQATMDDRAPDSPLVVRADVVNRGNVRYAPSLDIIVMDVNGSEVIRESVRGAPIEPASKQRVEFAASEGLPRGLYTAQVSIPQEIGGGAPKTIAFEVRGGGATGGPRLTPSGSLTELRVEPTPSIGRVASLAAKFTNDGAADIESAKLTVEVYRDGERIAVIFSDPLRLPVDSVVDLEAFYEVKHAGRHVLKSYVTYDGLRTPVKEAAFDVTGGSQASEAASAKPATGTTGAVPANTEAVAGTGATERAPGAAETTSKTPGPGAFLTIVGAIAALALTARRRSG